MPCQETHRESSLKTPKANSKLEGYVEAKVALTATAALAAFASFLLATRSAATFATTFVMLLGIHSAPLAMCSLITAFNLVSKISKRLSDFAFIE